MNNQAMTLRQLVRWIVVVCAVVSVICCAVGIDAANAGIDTRRLTVTDRGLVTHSTLPHCVNDDPESSDPPCTWNIGPGRDGDGRGLAYWVSRNHHAHYVWRTNPVVNHPARSWMSHRQANRLGGDRWLKCWINVGPTTYIGCPNGHRIGS